MVSFIYVFNIYPIIYSHKCFWNADFDGDVLNHLALTMEEFWELFDGFSPEMLMINRTNNTIKYDLSAIENIELSILSDN